VPGEFIEEGARIVDLLYVIWPVLAAVFIAAAIGMRYQADRAARPNEAARDPMFRTPSSDRKPGRRGPAARR
jgi:hypothetical protein